MFYDELNMFTYARLRDIIWLSKLIFEDKGWSAVSAYPGGLYGLEKKRLLIIIIIIIIYIYSFEYVN